MPTKGYQTYRGRSPLWKKILIILLVLILLGAGAFLFVQMRQAQIFDENGGHFRLPGFLTAQPQDGEPSSSGEDPTLPDDLILDVQEPEPANTLLAGRTIPAESLQNEDFAALAEGERPVLTVKSANGVLLYGSLEDAGAAMVRAKIEGRDAVARIACFNDSRKAGSDWAFAVMGTNGRVWLDADNKRWLAPYAENVTEYLTAIAADCKALGFTEIVLDGVQFPTDGNLSRIRYPEEADTPEKRLQVICAFLDAMKAAVGEETPLSLALPKELIETGVDEAAGWDLAELAGHVDRIYVPVENQATADRLRAIVDATCGDVSSAPFFVAESAAAITGGSYVLVQ